MFRGLMLLQIRIVLLVLKDQQEQGEDHKAPHVFCLVLILDFLKTWESFLKNDDNKADLNKLITKYCLKPQSVDWDKEIVVSYNHTMKSKSDGVKDVFRWIDDTHEEADNGIDVHVQDMLKTTFSI